MRNNSSVQILTDRTATGADAKHFLNGIYHVVQVIGTTTSGAGTATVLLEGSNKADPSATAGSTDWVTINSFAVSVTDPATPATGSYAFAAPWRWVRMRVSAIAGTGTTLQAYLSN